MEFLVTWQKLKLFSSLIPERCLGWFVLRWGIRRPEIAILVLGSFSKLANPERFQKGSITFSGNAFLSRVYLGPRSWFFWDWPLGSLASVCSDITSRVECTVLRVPAGHGSRQAGWQVLSSGHRPPPLGGPSVLAALGAGEGTYTEMKLSGGDYGPWSRGFPAVLF